MAGYTYTINFDTGIEKVEYSSSLSTFPEGEVTNSGQSIRGNAEFYVRPVFKQVYELDTTNVFESGRAGIYTTDSNNVNITDVTFTSKQGGVISGETWLLNDTFQLITKLYYYFDSSYEADTPIMSYEVNFKSNGQSFVKLTGSRVGPDPSIEANKAVAVFTNSDEWVNEAYRTITFDEPVTDTNLLAWLQANGTKQ